MNTAHTDRPHTQSPRDLPPRLDAIDAIISDVDGCLGPESHAPLNAPALARIAAYNQRASKGAAPILTMCTGRPQPYVEALVRLLAVPVPAVCEMGVWLYDPRDNRFIMDPAITPDHIAMVRAAQTWIERTLVPQGVAIQPGKSASISLWHPDTTALLALKPQLVETFAREGWNLRVSNTVAWINCDLAHVSKGSGLDRLFTMMGYTKDRLAGIGDTMGDMCIRDRVRVFACPANAAPDLKAKADYVSTKENIEGVLEMLSWWDKAV